MSRTERRGFTPDDIVQNPELYLLGTLSPDEESRFRAAVAAGRVDPTPVREGLEAFTAVLEELATPMPAPRRKLKEQILGEIASIVEAESPKPAPAPVEPAKPIYVAADDRRWRATGIPGISIKIIHRDKESGMITLLAKMEPGAAYPTHIHHGMEEAFILEGDLECNGVHMQAGDFAVTYGETVHENSRSHGGCIALLRTPMDEEYL